ncbi:hypothetical protein PV08_12005 [Exophiala spinifera]|uniref:Zn(2)-C6 fungal-type domain-containing protein n=1 Tax=Exophiala spinifera TaxID=91928 RepID=A0A0D1Y436_9EURO|nr:uncharacterized protein PV08_12005 [Exophiala spinifera]KIW09721.1 hypothetical protein PV08_12005 [Exophiala spinifera]
MEDNLDEISAQGSSSVAYRPQGKRIRVIQQFVETILEDDTASEPPRQPSEQDEEVHLYDFIGAVGIQKDRRGKKSVRYHVKWKGYGIKAMTWEPEGHIFEGDLLKLWSKYGRIYVRNRKGRQVIRHCKQQLHHYDPTEVHGSKAPETAQAHHVTPPGSPENIEEPCEQNVERDGGGDGLFLSQNPKAPAELDGGDGDDLPRCTPPTSPTSRHSPAPPQQGFARLRDAHQHPLESIPQLEVLETSQGLLNEEVTPSSQSDIHEINPTETIGPASVVSNVSVQHASISHDKARRKKWFTRTTTGCLSCRRRRVKCDEHRPSCVNCVRRKLPCEGYDSGPQWMKPQPTTMDPMGRDLGVMDMTMLGMAQHSESHGRISSHFLPNKCLSHSDEYHKKPRYLPSLAELDWATLGKYGHAEWPLKPKDAHGQQSSLLTEDTPRPIQCSNLRPISYYTRALSIYTGPPLPVEPSVLYGSDIAQQSRLGDLPSPLRRITELYDLSSAGRALFTNRE